MPKKAFALRIDEKLFKAVEKWASDEFRSTNGQIEYLLNEAVKKAHRQRKTTQQDSGKKEDEE